VFKYRKIIYDNRYKIELKHPSVLKNKHA
jgi:hypothetical protein